MTAIHFLFDSFFRPKRWLLSKSEPDSSIIISSLTLFNTKSPIFWNSFSAMPCNNRQLRRECCSYLSTISSDFSIFSFIIDVSIFISLINLCFSCCSGSSSSNLALIEINRFTQSFQQTFTFDLTLWCFLIHWKNFRHFFSFFFVQLSLSIYINI